MFRKYQKEFNALQRIWPLSVSLKISSPVSSQNVCHCLVSQNCDVGKKKKKKLFWASWRNKTRSNDILHGLARPNAVRCSLLQFSILFRVRMPSSVRVSWICLIVETHTKNIRHSTRKQKICMCFDRLLGQRACKRRRLNKILKCAYLFLSLLDANLTR